MTAPQAHGASVAYLLKRFPRLSETFILHEILELERQGMKLRLYSLLDPAEEIVQADVALVRAPVRYLPAGRGAVLPVLRAHVSLLRRDPRRALGGVADVLQRRRSWAALKHFARA